MRRLVYVMENGVVETSMDNANAWDMPYKIASENVPEKKPELLPKQKMARKPVR